MTITPRGLSGTPIGESWISILPEDREADGRVRMRYYIDTPDWAYEEADLFSGCHTIPTPEQALEALLAFLSSAAEQYRSYTMRNRSMEDPLFPSHVMEWAYMNEDALVLASVGGIIQVTTNE